MIAPVFDEIPAYEQAFSPNLFFFQQPRLGEPYAKIKKKSGGQDGNFACDD
jgi:hypothetical protein